MAKKCEWDFFDFFRGIKLSLSFEKLAWSFTGLFLAAALFSLLSWLGSLFDTPESSTWMGTFQCVGVIGGMLIVFLFGGGLGRMVVSEERDDEQLFMGETGEFVKKNFLKILLLPLMYIGLFLFFWVLIYLGGLIGQIPLIGTWFWGLFYFCAAGLGLLCIFFGIMAFLALFVYPGIVGSRPKAKLTETLFGSIGVLFPNIIKLVIYLIITKIILAIVYTVIWLLVSSSVATTQCAMKTSGEKNYNNFVSAVAGNYYSVHADEDGDKVTIYEQDDIDILQGKEVINPMGNKILESSHTDDIVYTLCLVPRTVLKFFSLDKAADNLVDVYVPGYNSDDSVVGEVSEVSAGTDFGGFLAMLSICIIFAAALAVPFSLNFTLGTMAYLIAKGDDDDYEFDEEEEANEKKKEEEKKDAAPEEEKVEEEKKEEEKPEENEEKKEEGEEEKNEG